MTSNHLTGLLVDPGQNTQTWKLNNQCVMFWKIIIHLHQSTHTDGCWWWWWWCSTCHNHRNGCFGWLEQFNINQSMNIKYNQKVFTAFTLFRKNKKITQTSTDLHTYIIVMETTITCGPVTKDICMCFLHWACIN